MPDNVERDRVLASRSILELATAFQRSRVLLTAYELDLFTALGDGERDAVEVARAIGCDARATDRLMNALTAMGLLDKRDGRFRNGPAAAECLVKGTPGYMAGLAHTGHLWTTWSPMTDVVRRGGPDQALAAVDDRGIEWLQPFIAAMHWRARQAAPAVVRLIDLDGVSRVLDVGGGSGAYAMAFATARHGISATVFDLPSVVPLTRSYIEQEGLAADVGTASGDYLRDELGTGYDLVFMSAVVHSNSAGENRRLVGKAAAALQPGGRVVIQDFLIDEGRTGPLQPALFALNMLVGTRSGDTYTESEVRGWLTEAGLHDVTRTDTPAGTSLMTGRK